MVLMTVKLRQDILAPYFTSMHNVVVDPVQLTRLTEVSKLVRKNLF